MGASAYDDRVSRDRLTRRCLVPLAGLLLACHGAPTVAEPPARSPRLPPLLAELELPDPGPAVDPDGEDDGSEAMPPPGAGLAELARAPEARFVAVAAPPRSAHPRVCDLRGFAGGVYVAHLAKAIDLDGARVHRYDAAADAWTLAFDWDRGGVPGKTREVGGQGITRVRVIDGRLFAPDADPPTLGGFGLSAAPFESYLFVSDERGGFPPLGAGDLPPTSTRVVPFSFHAFDVTGYRGALVVSGGTAALGLGRVGRYPGGLFVGERASGELPPRWPVGRPGEGVLRTTFFHRFGGRLYVGLQNNERRTHLDLAVLTGDPLDPATSPPVAVRVTEGGGWLTRRFASGDGRLYWLASGYPGDGRPATLFVSRDGVRFEPVARPPGAGELQDVAVVGRTVYVLATDGLYRRDPAGLVRLAAAPPGDPFGVWDTFCSAPLERVGDTLWAGSLRDGQIYRVEPQPVPEDPRAALVDLAGGWFEAGDPRGEPSEAPRRVQVAPFRLMRFEVTNAQFAAFVAATGHVTDAERKRQGHVWWRHDGKGKFRWKVLAGADWRHPHGPGSSVAHARMHAVVQVSADDAAAFCAHHGLRLPTDQEWEWAARGHDGRRYVWGDGPPEQTPATQRGNVGVLGPCCAPDASDGHQRIAPVGSFPAAATAAGIHDLVGNVWEWTSTPAQRPGNRLIRGAGWGNSSWCLRAAYRHENPADRGLDMVGFRCAGDP